MAPMLPAKSLFSPIIGACVYAGIFYIFIMPHLSGFFQLGSAIFIFMFLINYYFWKPQQALSLVGANAAFLLLTFINNEQTYSFSAYANTFSCFVLSTGIAVICSYIPTSPRPEKNFIRLLNRFHKNSNFLISRMAIESNRKKGLIAFLQVALHRNDQITLPVKIAQWGGRINHKDFPGNSPEQVQSLLTAFSEFSLRINIVLDAGKRIQDDLRLKDFHNDFYAWWIWN